MSTTPDLYQHPLLPATASAALGSAHYSLYSLHHFHSFGPKPGHQSLNTHMGESRQQQPPPLLAVNFADIIHYHDDLMRL